MPASLHDGYVPGVRRVLLVGAPVLCLVIAGFFLLSPASAMEGQIVRVVDGDTVLVRTDSKIIRVRILNIDTPETVDPSKEPQCLGRQASEFTKALLPAGTRVKLTFDKEREDKYGRTLARVQLRDGRSVATEIAKVGLGVPIVVGENRAGYAEVKGGSVTAERKKRGYFDPSEECTFPAHQRALDQDLTTAEAISSGTSIAEAGTAAAAAYALVKAHQKYFDGVGTAISLPIRAIRAVGSTALITRYQTRFKSLRKVWIDFKAEKEDREAAEAQRLKEAEEARAAAAELARQQAAERARQQAAAAAAARAREQSDNEDDNSDGGSSGDGNRAPCRHYAPGGKTWTPMPCP